MKFFNVRSEAEALSIVRALAKGYTLGTERVHTVQACDRVLTENIMATTDVPAFNRSTMDGYAVISHDTHGATTAIPTLLNVKGVIEMGQVVTTGLHSLETMYVPTGGMLPTGAESVVMIEDTEVLDDETIAVFRAVTLGDNVIHKGDDIAEGTIVLNKGKQLTPVDIGVLSALGISEVEVSAKMKVTILSTGDEIIEIDQEASLGQIYDINGNVLSILCKDLGLEVLHKAIIKDKREALYEAVYEATKTSDLILLSGGSSVGTRDYTYDVINRLRDSEMLLQGVAVKPGKPTILGKGNGKVIFGLPGHPVSSIMIFKIFVEEFIRGVIGLERTIRTFEGELTESVHAAPGRNTYQMVNLSVTDGEVKVIPSYGRSGMITLLASSIGYIRIDSDAEGIEAGTHVKGCYF